MTHWPISISDHYWWNKDAYIMHFLLTSYALIMFLKGLSHFIGKIKNFMKYFKMGSWNISKFFEKFLNISKWNISSCIPSCSRTARNVPLCCSLNDVCTGCSTTSQLTAGYCHFGCCPVRLVGCWWVVSVCPPSVRAAPAALSRPSCKLGSAHRRPRVFTRATLC